MLFSKTDYVKGKKRKETQSQGGIFVFVMFAFWEKKSSDEWDDEKYEKGKENNKQFNKNGISSCGVENTYKSHNMSEAQILNW